MTNTSLAIGYCIFAIIWTYFMYHLLKQEKKFHMDILEQQKRIYDMQKDLYEQLYEWAENPYISHTYNKN